MKIVRRIINYLNLISSVIPLVIFIVSNLYILYTAVMSWFIEHQVDDYTWMGIMFLYVLLFAPICLAITMVYEVLWLAILYPTVAELIFAGLKSKIITFIFDIFTNITSYILLAWLVLFFIASTFYDIFGVMLIGAFGGNPVFVDVLGYLSYGTLYAIIISFVTTILYSIILIIDLIVSKIRSKKAEGLVQKQ